LHDPAVILDNGVIRTMDATLPVARALAIAGDRIAGGVGTHETALASPERVDVRGRCVVPGFTDSHTHFPTWALAREEVRLEDTRTLEEAL
jgi:predicted amidohydrolase YtcJ